MLDVYNERTPNIRFGGPTNFAPLIEKAIEIVKETKQVLVYSNEVTDMYEGCQKSSWTPMIQASNVLDCHYYFSLKWHDMTISK